MIPAGVDDLSWMTLAAAVLAVLLPIIATLHITLTKRDHRGAMGWIGAVWLAPYLGSVLYVIFGINRIRRRATRLRPEPIHPKARRARPRPRVVEEAAGLAELVGNVTDLPLTAGNDLTPLINGDAAYPAMLAAIEDAQSSIALATYIFDNDPVGRQFVAALARAVKRGVEVRVLVDSVGARYAFPRIFSELSRADIPWAEFLHSFIPWRMSYLNMRNHRKILVTDGRMGFTGGINIRRWHVLRELGDPQRDGIEDLHFRVEGPVVEQMMNVFAEDWAFTVGEVLSGECWFPPLDPVGSVAARGITGGPDEDYDRLRLVIMAALSEAKKSIVIVTPYFLPDDVLIALLNLKAMSGVMVDILVPRRGNLRLVQWASSALAGQLLERGCRIWLTPPPFDHSKFILVDGVWTFIGSANIDPRSLYLNFEFNLECYNADLAARLAELAAVKRSTAHALTVEEWAARSLPVKLRDGFARLLSPYL